VCEGEERINQYLPLPPPPRMNQPSLSPPPYLYAYHYLTPPPPSPIATQPITHLRTAGHIVMFNKGAGNQALVQYPDVASAQAAYEQVGGF
jgi:hypothetical protein